MAIFGIEVARIVRRRERKVRNGKVNLDEGGPRGCWKEEVVLRLEWEWGKTESRGEGEGEDKWGG